MKFTEESMVVKCWVKMIENGMKTLQDVPDLWNLKEVVTTIIGEKVGEN